MIKKLSSIAAAICIIFFLNACASIPKEIPEDLTAQEIVQRAQEYFDKADYDAALFLYETIIERYADDPAVLVAAEYEIAHIKIKQNKFSEAKPMLESILAKYDGINGKYLPQEYKKLAYIDLAKTTEK